ncbi:MAG: hypothetical protein IJA15_06165 [Clostridia bacterium]|nr:hypothetical protein [Clostridia bacterium]
MRYYDNQKELMRHKSSDSVKWWLTLIAFVIIGIMLTGIIVGWFNNTSEEKESEEATVIETVNTVHPMPKFMTFTSNSLLNAVSANANSVDVTIQATVKPFNASNQKVDFSVAWKDAPTYGKEKVSDYVTVTQASDGATTATVSCFKAFGNDTIELKVTTRDGGFTDTCIIKYKGTALSLEVESNELVLSESTEREEYYEIGTNKTYNFDIVMDNAFSSVGTYDLAVEVSAVGLLYFGDGSVDPWSGMFNFSEFRELELSHFVDSFITSASIEGTTLKITTGEKCVEEFYEESVTDEELLATNYKNRYVFYDEFGYTVGNGYEEKATENLEKIKSSYFLIKVTDKTSGLSDEIKLWLVYSVNGVELNKEVVEY